ncbi:hypothetical protein PGIGA_G00252470 [Pangasianodon gigas]|uniref:Uncharacterized protein n=1 Tax=Pangasianodon gigas TaxID=30993 RepID=A0ACC5WQU1_PANGG|nr:hypothetical protein [Pangasianodon gigas]
METQKKIWVSVLLLVAVFQPTVTAGCNTQLCNQAVDGSLFDYGAKTLTGDLYIPFRLTFQYLELNALQEELKDLGLVILGFPCNQFGKQEPGYNHEILPMLKHIRPGKGFVPNFQLFETGDVNGHHEQSVFTFLKNACPPVGDSFGNPSGRLFWEPLKVTDIKWNFEKFLVGPDGKPLMRWFPRVNVSEVRADIIKLINERNSKN